MNNSDDLIRNIEATRYYVYTYASSLDNEIFYVGKGCEDRYIQHIREARREDIIWPSGEQKKPTRVVSTIRFIWKQGGKVIIRKPYKNIPDLEALNTEKALILSYGYGQLVNQRWYDCHKAVRYSLLESPR
ncbi:MAG TPA: GIY-YIG nuclease family protein [Methylomirabilota bacterium]|nr:GIY-YIG nuclease family protein [Methylomirabilota bacterium]